MKYHETFCSVKIDQNKLSFKFGDFHVYCSKGIKTLLKWVLFQILQLLGDCDLLDIWIVSIRQIVIFLTF
jgi:hypothetical protein